MSTQVLLYLVILASCYVQGQVFFEEGDFSSDGNVSQIRVTKNGGITEPIFVTIQAMTIAEYSQLGRSDCILPSSADPAESEDFDNTPLHATFFPSGADTIIFNLPLPQDVVVEATEIFVVVMNITGGGLTITRGCTVIRIEEIFTGKFFQWTRNGQEITTSLTLTFPEMNSRQLLITADRIVPAEISTEITATVLGGGLAMENSDFRLNRTHVIPPDISSVDILIDIIDDDVVERDEAIVIDLVATAAGALSPSHISVTVSILDDEVINYVFMNTPSVINVTEGETATVFTGSDPALTSNTRNDLAVVQSEDGSAIEGTDFIRVSQSLPAVAFILPTTITTISRPGIQATRSFTLRLLPISALPPHRLTNINGTVMINILDDPTITVIQWSRNGDSLNSSISLDLEESSGSQHLLTVDRRVPLSQPITVTVTVSGTATENSDFVLNRTYVLPPDRSSVDILLDIIDDDLPELDETIIINLRAEIPGLTLPDAESNLEVVVNLRDNEVLNYVFLNTPPVLNVTEGDSITLEAGLFPILSTGTRGPIGARIQTQSGSATEGTDFTKADSEFLISSTPFSQVIMTTARSGFQSTRSFTVHLLPNISMASPHPLLNINGTVTINILDDPSASTVVQWSRNGAALNSSLSLNLQEDSGSQVLFTIDRRVPLSQPITVTATVVSGTATQDSDFVLNRTYVLPPDRSSVDILLDIIDDDLPELDETITINLRAEIPGLTLPDAESNLEVVVNLRDNDVLNYAFLNALPVLNITEGESVTFMTGLTSATSIGTRGQLVALIQSESGSAIEGTDFTKVNSQIRVQSTPFSQTVTTISRPGIQPTRSFVLRLSPDSTSTRHRLTDISGSIVINILDNSMRPLAPLISKLSFNNDDELEVEWNHESSGSRPVDHFTIIIKSCDKTPCLIDPDKPQPDEKENTSPKDTRKYTHMADLEFTVFSVLVCAENSLGRNCSMYRPRTDTIVVTPQEPKDPFLIWLIIIIVVLLLLCCCCIPIIIICLCCCYKRDKERAYYPKRNMGRKLKGASPDSADSNSMDMYVDEMKYSDLKYI